MIWRLIAIGLLVAAGYILLLWPQRQEDQSVYTRALYAHRGLHGQGCAENSLEAFARAVEQGYGIELDVRLSADGEVMVFHDDSLLRMCGVDALVIDRTKQELDELFLGNTNAHIPTFSQALALVDGRVPLLVELKYGKRSRELCEKTAALLAQYHGVYAIESFNPMIVRWFKKHTPQVFRGVLYNKMKIFRDVMPLPVRWLLGSMLLNGLCRPNFVAFNQQYVRELPLLIVRRIFRGCTIAWTVEGDAPPDVDCDTYIFELEGASDASGSVS